MAKKSGQYPSDKLDQSLVRWPTRMKRIIEERAKKNGRPVNTEIVELVRTGLKHAVADDAGYKPSGIVSAELVQELEIFIDNWRSKVAAERILNAVSKMKL